MLNINHKQYFVYTIFPSQMSHFMQHHYTKPERKMQIGEEKPDIACSQVMGVLFFNIMPLRSRFSKYLRCMFNGLIRQNNTDKNK